MKRGCVTCKYRFCSVTCAPCDNCAMSGDAYSEWVARTNADHIRSMTDEELAEWFGMSERMCPDGFSETIDCDACPEVCTGHWLLWLKEEVKDD